MITLQDNRLAAAERHAGLAHEPPPRGYGAQAVRHGVSTFTVPRGPDPLPPTWPVTAGAKRLLELTAGDCKFPVGDADGHLQLFCAGPRMKPAPYCKGCMARVASGRKLNKITVPE